MFVDPKKYGDQVQAPPRIHYRPDSCPSYRQPLVRPFANICTLLLTNELYIVERFLARLIVGRPLGT